MVENLLQKRGMIKECKICSDSVEAFYDKRMKSDFFYCKECHYFFKDESNFLSSQEELAIYDQHNNSLDNEGYVQMLEDYIAYAITPFSPKNILEFGSGPTPVLSELLKQKDYSVDIYDKYYAPKEVFEGKEYDLISSTEVIEHIEDVKGVMHFFNKHLKSGGYLSLMTQFHKDDIEQFQKWWYPCDRTHISFCNRETFKVLAKLFSFQLLRCDDKKIIVLQKV